MDLKHQSPLMKNQAVRTSGYHFRMTERRLASSKDDPTASYNIHDSFDQNLQSAE